MPFTEKEIRSGFRSLFSKRKPKPTAIPSTGSDITPFSDDLPPADGDEENPKVDDYSLPPPDDEEPPPAYTEEEMRDACDIAIKTLCSRSGQTELYSEVKRLGESAASIDRCFRNVAQGLRKAVDAATTDTQTQEMTKFQETWSGLQKTYVGLVWRSRDIAGKAAVVATDFAGVFLPAISDPAVSLEDKRKAIDNYIQKVDRDKEDSGQLSQGFTDLQSAVAEFHADIKNFEKKSDDLKVEIKDLSKDIEEIKEKLGRLAKEECTLMSAVRTLGLTLASFGLMAVGVICPNLWISAANSAAKTGKVAKECWDTNIERQMVSDELDEKKNILEDHQKSLEGLEKICTILCTLHSDMDLIHEKLGIFAQIWIFIRADLGKIREDLDLASCQAGTLQVYFDQKIKAVSVTYKSLARVFHWYETNIHVQRLETISK